MAWAPFSNRAVVDLPGGISSLRDFVTSQISSKVMNPSRFHLVL
jgi:hypothetical protein